MTGTDLFIIFVNSKHKKGSTSPSLVPCHHFWSTDQPTDQPSLSNIILLSLSSLTIAKKGKRGFKFTVAELEHMLNVINDIVHIGNPDWEKVWQEHSAAYPTMEQTPE
jgi:hypothetical protein